MARDPMRQDERPVGMAYRRPILAALLVASFGWAAPSSDAKAVSEAESMWLHRVGHVARFKIHQGGETLGTASDKVIRVEARGDSRIVTTQLYLNGKPSGSPSTTTIGPEDISYDDDAFHYVGLKFPLVDGSRWRSGNHAVRLIHSGALSTTVAYFPDTWQTTELLANGACVNRFFVKGLGAVRAVTRQPGQNPLYYDTYEVQDPKQGNLMARYLTAPATQCLSGRVTVALKDGTIVPGGPSDTVVALCEPSVINEFRSLPKGKGKARAYDYLLALSHHALIGGSPDASGSYALSGAPRGNYVLTGLHLAGNAVVVWTKPVRLPIRSPRITLDEEAVDEVLDTTSYAHSWQGMSQDDRCRTLVETVSALTREGEAASLLDDRGMQRLVAHFDDFYQDRWNMNYSFQEVAADYVQEALESTRE